MARSVSNDIQLGSVSEKVYAGVLKEIDTGSLAPLSRLPTEQELCDTFGASRTAVRRALKRLSVEGRIESRQGSGSFVKEIPSSKSFSNTVSVMFQGGAERLTRVQDLALQHGHVLAIYSHVRSGWKPRREAEFLKQVRRQRHRALLAMCSPLGPRNDSLLAQIARAGTRVIHLEHYRKALPDQDYMLLDYKRAAHAATIHLMLAGYDRLVLAGMKPGGPFCRLDERGFLEALSDHGDGAAKLQDLSADGRSGNYLDLPRVEEGVDREEAMDEFAEALSPGTGVVCCSHRWAEWVMAGLTRRGVAVPDDVGVIAVQTMGETHEQQEAIDHVGFGDEDVYLRAVRTVLAPDFDGIKELVSPKIVKCGTVRAGRAD